MQNIPDYEHYKDDELIDAYSHIVKEKYPDRAKLIEHEFDKRGLKYLNINDGSQNNDKYLEVKKYQEHINSKSSEITDDTTNFRSNFKIVTISIIGVSIMWYFWRGTISEYKNIIIEIGSGKGDYIELLCNKTDSKYHY